MNAKTRAITSLHRDSSLPKVPGFCPLLASVNAYLLYCRPLCIIDTKHFNTKIMKPSILLFLFFSLMLQLPINSYAGETINNQTVVAGRIIGSTIASEIIIRSSLLSEISTGRKTNPDVTGNFIFKFTLPYEIELNLFIQQEKLGTRLLLGPGDSLFIIIDKSKEPSFTFFGNKGEFHNNLYDLSSSIRRITKFEDPMIHWRNDTPEQFYAFQLEKYKTKIDSLKSFSYKGHYPNTMIEFYKSKYKVGLGYELLEFLSMQQAIKHIRPTKETVPENYFHTIDSIFENSLNDYNVDEYHNFLGLYSTLTAFEIYDTVLNTLLKHDRVLSSKIQMDYNQKRFSGIQRDYLVALVLSGLIKDGYIDSQTYERYSSTVSNSYYKDFLLKEFKESQLLWADGFDISKQHITDLSLSETTSLFNTLKKDHSGKVVYIDIWATWCGPCISNFAYMPKLKEIFKYFDIDFVYLATSSDKKAWLSLIKANKLTGYHYFLSEKQTKELKSIIDYSLIPRYAIMDRNGKIIIPDAKMPGDPDLIDQLKDLLIKQN
jgi:thiol-disulfide isomerase/thioredoxin